MVIYSHSRLSSFEQCPFKFKLRYLDKIKPDFESSIESHLGSVTHNTLEWLYIEVKKGNMPSIEEVIVYYSENWQNNYKEGTLIVRKNLTVKDYFNKGVKFILDYYMKHKPFQDGTLELEKRILIDLNGDGKYKIQGFIDRLTHNKETNEYEVHDYKTANSLPKREKVETDRQLALYSIAIKEIFGQNYNVLLIWHYLAHNVKITSRRTSDQLEQLKKDIMNLIDEIEVTKDFPPKKSVLCGWCEYKSKCPHFGGAVREQQKMIENYPTLSKYIKD